MSKQQIQIMVILCGAALIALLLTKQFLVKRHAGGAAGAGQSASVAGLSEPKPAAQIKFELPPLAEETVTKQKLGLQASWGRNPFVLVSKVSKDKETQGPLSGLWISAIIVKDGRGMAIVNGEIMSEGDTLRGYKVMNIRTTGIELQRGEEKVVIPYGK